MKNYTLILSIVVIMTACHSTGGRKSITTSITPQIETIAAEETVDANEQEGTGEIDPSKIKVEAEIAKWIGEDTTLMTIAEIDSKLAKMFDKYYDSDFGNDNDLEIHYPDIIKRVLQHYLKNPLTFTQKMPLLDEKINIICTPDGKYKFYNYWLYGGSSSWEVNFVQYWNDDGEVEYMPYKNHLRYERGIADVWQFMVKDKTYYAIKSFRRESAGTWQYYLEIVSNLSGVITVHSEFFPEEVKQIITHEECLLYDKSGKFIDYGTEKTACAVVCGTVNMNTNVDFTFDPQTLVVSVKDDADTSDSRTAAITRKQWKLKI